MCGITGVLSFEKQAVEKEHLLLNAVARLNKRGPDNSAVFFHNHVGLGHARLSIIDTSDIASQPFTDSSGRYTIVFNGEIFNFKELKKELISKGIHFRSQSDTEVLLALYISEGETLLNKLNGFFAFAIYDNIEQTLFIARDRMGIKPLLYYHDENQFCFASEHKALQEYNIPRVIDHTSVYNYFQLNYIPGNDTVFENVKRLAPATFLKVKGKIIEQKTYYSLCDKSEVFQGNTPTYADAQQKLLNLLESSVQMRLISDVPLGAFLSGGIDSSAIVSLASKHTSFLNTFSIGYRDEPLFDETSYAELVAKKFNTNHTTFSLSNNDIFDVLFDVLDYIDEPFADSSALAVYILCKQTRNKVTVALSGDGADEIFAGYNKHMAEYRVRNAGIKENILSFLKPVWGALPKSRNGKFSNTIRQFNKFAQLSGLSVKERYWFLCSIASQNQASSLLKNEVNTEIYTQRKSILTSQISEKGSFNQVLLSDLKMVLPNDMLTKVDLMSMANSLEVRTPFLDYRIIDYANSLPSEYKIDANGRKKILRDAFRNILPVELYNRPKHGFEVPLLKWMRKELKSIIFDDLLNKDFVESQGIFHFSEIDKIRKQLFSSNPGDAAARIWALTVFQWWWKKNINS